LYGLSGDSWELKYCPTLSGPRIWLVMIERKRSSGCRCWPLSQLTLSTRSCSPTSKITPSITAVASLLSSIAQEKRPANSPAGFSATVSSRGREANGSFIVGAPAACRGGNL